MYVGMYVCMYVCMGVCVCMHACMYVCINVCIYVCMYVCIHARTYVDIHIHLHTYIHTVVPVRSCVFVSESVCFLVCELPVRCSSQRGVSAVKREKTWLFRKRRTEWQQQAAHNSTLPLVVTCLSVNIRFLVHRTKCNHKPSCRKIYGIVMHRRFCRCMLSGLVVMLRQGRSFLSHVLQVGVSLVSPEMA